MNIEDLCQRCALATQQQSHDPSVTLVIPQGWKAPKGFPRRTLLCVNGKGERVYSISALRVLNWAASNGLILLDKRSAPVARLGEK